MQLATPNQADLVMIKTKSHLLKVGGIVTTNNLTGEQWDAPNGWAPLQWIAIKGLENYHYKEPAKDIATRWIAINEKVFKETGKMMEKYNVLDTHLEAGGGEYPGQDGFGWTNGVYLKLISIYAPKEEKKIIEKVSVREVAK
jgi:alpha,alpha-trehalase